jgi:hypothetical protein
MAVSPANLDFTFLNAVNRILRANSILKGDDDALTSFSQTQHAATLEIAKVAIQDELVELTVDRLVPLERTSGTIITSSGVRTYSLSTDFIQFWGAAPFLYNSSSNRQIYQFPGGEEALAISVFDYTSQTGDPAWWYFVGATSKQIGLYQVPNGVYNYTYQYERSVMVETANDDIPFHDYEQVYAFTACAGRRFKFMFENVRNVDGILAQDPAYLSAKARLVRLLTGQNPKGNYGFQYV